jgi:hypothetical protein
LKAQIEACGHGLLVTTMTMSAKAGDLRASFLDGGETGRMSKVRFDRPLVDHRPDLRNSLVAKLIEDVLGEDDPSAVHRQAKKQTLGPAVESEPARDMGRFADHELDVELEVRDLGEIPLEHGAIAGETEWPAIVTRVFGDEAMQIRPVLPVQAGNVAAVEVGESGCRGVT